MISTLIRSKQGHPLPLVEGKSEYLVDTESNTIIYPKTRIEDIIGLENLDIPNKPGQILGGGIDPNSYIHNVVKLTGVTIRSVTTNKLGEVEIANPGIYLINLNLHLVVLPSYSAYHNSSLIIKTPNQSHQSDYLINSGTYGRRTMSIIDKVTEPTTVEFYTYIVTPTFTCNGNSFYQYTIIKLCDIPQTD